jgi:hypothetical protein
VSEDRLSNAPRSRVRLPFGGTGGRSFRVASLVIYAVLTTGLVVVALHAALVLRLSPTSGYVAAPAIGALWFALRLFMIWGSRG